MPGFVYTKMTKELYLPKFLTSSAQDIAAQIIKGYMNKKSHIYPNFKWRVISFVIKLIPEFIFKKFKF